MSAYTSPGVQAALDYFRAYYNDADRPQDDENLFPYFIADVLHAGVKLTGVDADVLGARAVHVMAGDLEEADARHRSFGEGKVPVLVYAFHTFESGGGFNWAPDTEDNRRTLQHILATDRDMGNYDSGTLVSMFITEYEGDRERVTAFFEWALQDAIEVGAVGHIIERFSFEPVPSV